MKTKTGFITFVNSREMMKTA